jgi:hypothetical protein
MHAELDIAPEAAIGRVRTEEMLPVQPAGPPDKSTFPGAERRTAMDAHGATPGVNASAVDSPHRLRERPAPRARMSACRRREHQSCSYDANGSPQDQPSEQKSHGAPQATSADRLFPQGPTAETRNGRPFSLIGPFKHKVGGTRFSGRGTHPACCWPQVADCPVTFAPNPPSGRWTNGKSAAAAERFTRAGARLSPTRAGGPSACRRHSAATSRLTGPVVAISGCSPNVRATWDLRGKRPSRALVMILRKPGRGGLAVRQTPHAVGREESRSPGFTKAIVGMVCKRDQVGCFRRSYLRRFRQRSEQTRASALFENGSPQTTQGRDVRGCSAAYSARRRSLYSARYSAFRSRQS